MQGDPLRPGGTRAQQLGGTCVQGGAVGSRQRGPRRGRKDRVSETQRQLVGEEPDARQRSRGGTRVLDAQARQLSREVEGGFVTEHRRRMHKRSVGRVEHLERRTDPPRDGRRRRLGHPLDTRGCERDSVGAERRRELPEQERVATRRYRAGLREGGVDRSCRARAKDALDLLG